PARDRRPRAGPRPRRAHAATSGGAARALRRRAPRGDAPLTLQARPTHDPEIAALGPWFHNLHLPDGRLTAPNHPLGDFPAFKWREIGRALTPGTQRGEGP